MAIARVVYLGIVVLAAFLILALPISSAVQAQGLYEPQLNMLLDNFLNCWANAQAVGIPNLTPAERFYCGAMMSNSHLALLSIYGSGSIGTYSPETQNKAEQAVFIIAPYTTNTPPPGTNSPLPGSPSAPVGSGWTADDFFGYMGSADSSSAIWGTYGDACNAVLGTCSVTDEATGTNYEIPWTGFGEEDVSVTTTD